MHGDWLCFGNRCMSLDVFLKSQHGSRSARFPFKLRCIIAICHIMLFIRYCREHWLVCLFTFFNLFCLYERWVFSWLKVNVFLQHLIMSSQVLLSMLHYIAYHISKDRIFAFIFIYIFMNINKFHRLEE